MVAAVAAAVAGDGTEPNRFVPNADGAVAALAGVWPNAGMAKMLAFDVAGAVLFGRDNRQCGFS